MDASVALLILAAVAPYLIWLIRFIMHSNSHLHHGAVNKEELSIIDLSASSSCPDPCPPPPPTSKYDVFLSFRGEDTRDNFTSHLYDALCRAKIDTYIDYRLDRGGEISPSLLKAIEESRIFVIIFSEDYASSSWCLDELVKILECKERDGRVVIPVFYNIDPSNVRKQSGSYADAFLKHEKRFKGNKDKVERWKVALFQAASLSGWDSTQTRPESKLTREIVKDILEKLNCISSCDLEGLVGIHKHIENMEALLSIGSPDIRIVGIWGMGGIGKTTIADVIFHKIKAQFESCSFVANVREQLAGNGLEYLQKKCFSELLEDEDFGISSLRSTCVKSRLQSKRILLVLDDVDNAIQADDLIKASHWFGLGSRIIITSRDEHVLKNAGAIQTYNVQVMNFQDALQLFSLKAFKKNQPTKDYVGLSVRVVDYCEGIPLALTVLGSFLYGRSEEEWKSALAKLEKAPKKEIFDVLKISFDGLDDAEKNVFLDLACFFSTRNMPYMQHIPDYYELPAYVEIRVLIEKSLIAVNAKGQILMHDLVVAMGQEIVSQQLAKNPEKPIRLWKHEDIYRALNNNTGTETIQCISLNVCKIKKIYVHAATFQNMYNLRFLEFYKSNPIEPSKVLILGVLVNLPDELRILRWEEYPLPSLPLRFCPENLVELIMRNSHLERLWDGDQLLPNLKIIDLEGSKRLIELPDLSQTCNIELLSLLNCVSLVQVYSSGSLAKLEILGLNYCNKLRSVGFASVNCKEVKWIRCPLRSLPLSFLSENLVELLMPHSHLEQLWDGDQHLPKLKVIYLPGSKNLVGLPDLCQAPNIEDLYLFDCPRLVQVFSSISLYKLIYTNLEFCHMLRSFHLEGNIHRRSSVLVAVYNYFDLDNFSFFKVNVSLSLSNYGNKPVLGLKVVSLSFSEICDCMNSVNGAELQLLGKTLASSLPNLTKIRWIHIPSSIGQFDLCFSQESYYNSPIRETKLELLRTSSKILEPAKSVIEYPCIKGTTIKEVSSPLEQLVDSENLIESGFSGFNRLPKALNNMGCLSFITGLSLQKSDIETVPASIPGLSSLISLGVCDCRSHQPIIDLSVSEDTVGNTSNSLGYSNQSTSFFVELCACPTRVMMRTIMGRPMVPIGWGWPKSVSRGVGGSFFLSPSF